MPRVIAVRPDQVVSIDLQGAVGRFDLAPSAWSKVPCVALAYRYIAPTTALMGPTGLVDLQPYAVVALARARIPFADSVAEAGRVVDAGLLGNGGLDADINRAEAARPTCRRPWGRYARSSARGTASRSGLAAGWPSAWN